VTSFTSNAHVRANRPLGGDPFPEGPLVEGIGLAKHYRMPATRLFERTHAHAALDGVNISVTRGESVAVVGESGSGKTTLLKLLLGLSQPTAGEVLFDDMRVDARRDRLLWLRRRTGVVFQDPYSSFNPRRTIGQTVAEPLVATGAQDDHRETVQAILTRMELPADSIDRYPHEFSGGQRQRIALARALVHGPEVLVADEPVSALDVLVRGRLLDLLAELRTEMGLTLITVTHDLAVVPRIAERIVVMRSGRIVETGTVSDIFHRAVEPYTRDLIEALPRLPLNK
jgi:ABC-type glutathione transport system ATPase component